MALYIRNRRGAYEPAPRFPMATLVWTADRYATGRLDTGGTVEIIIPNGLWCVTGDRVALFHYPDGWVAVSRQVIRRALEYR